MLTAGEPLNPSVFHAWQAATGLPIYEGYGQTETVILVGHFKNAGFTIVPGSMGKATPGYEVCLLDDQLQPVEDGEEGEIAVQV